MTPTPYLSFKIVLNTLILKHSFCDYNNCPPAAVPTRRGWNDESTPELWQDPLHLVIRSAALGALLGMTWLRAETQRVILIGCCSGPLGGAAVGALRCLEVLLG